MPSHGAQESNRYYNQHVNGTAHQMHRKKLDVGKDVTHEQIIEKAESDGSLLHFRTARRAAPELQHLHRWDHPCKQSGLSQGSDVRARDKDHATFRASTNMVVLKSVSQITALLWWGRIPVQLISCCSKRHLPGGNKVVVSCLSTMRYYHRWMDGSTFTTSFTSSATICKFLWFSINLLLWPRGYGHHEPVQSPERHNSNATRRRLITLYPVATSKHRCGADRLRLRRCDALPRATNTNPETGIETTSAARSIIASVPNTSVSLRALHQPLLLHCLQQRAKVCAVWREFTCATASGQTITPGTRLPASKADTLSGRTGAIGRAETSRCAASKSSTALAQTVAKKTTRMSQKMAALSRKEPRRAKHSRDPFDLSLVYNNTDEKFLLNYCS
ncbi:hypothetical protein P3T76_013555 [Phytophthora citrophthora]|uniref:Uncharacterized protein n=1 Tax=Phytophthora citrophthora TaxID=4793 RepID=A0AAD9LC23_9STRA|nr:hypothetical protein P3T76_013555 [Phytophthora citrophthora]